MWLLAIILPLLIGDLVPDDSEVWALYHILKRICSIAVLLVNESKEILEYMHSLHLNSQTIVHPTWIKYDFLLLKKFAYIYIGNGETLEK